MVIYAKHGLPSFIYSSMYFKNSNKHIYNSKKRQ